MSEATDRLRARWLAVFGLGLLVAYWIWVKPPGAALGYSGDMCSDTVRQLMAANFKNGAGIRFSSEMVMAPYGTSIPFMSWSIERDWLGAYAWLWDPTFPFLWVYLGVSWLLTYVFVAWVIRKLGLSRSLAWAFALISALLHVPRHFKIWHHFEHLTQHWVYAAFFLDALIWHRFSRENRVSRSYELWRVFIQLGAFCSTGYFWGITVFEWIVVRACLAAVMRLRARAGRTTAWQGSWTACALPLALCLGLAAVEVPWFAALARELHGGESSLSITAWFTNPLVLFRPLWLDYLGLPTQWVSHFNDSETVVSIGAFLALPAAIATWRLRRRSGGAGVVHALPFVIFVLCGMLYVQGWFPPALQKVLPFMSFFRVASRWGLFFPQLAMVLIVLSWADTGRWFAGLARHRVWAAILLVSSLAEASVLLDPINSLPPLPESVARMLEGVRDAPGDTVLDLPFCVAGGNGVCTQQQCPQYPGSIAGQCFRQWHGKRTYGLYQPRMYWAQCSIYDRAPFQSWFDAWGRDRCFSAADWRGFCSYLDRQPTLSAVLVYPGVWRAAARPECRAEFEAHLGPSLGGGTFMTEPTRGGQGTAPSEVAWYGPRCVRR